MVKKVNVAAAVIRRVDGCFLLGQRAPDTFYAGYWEFPGGKVEAGETPHDALIRELDEELGIVVRTAYPWIMREHHYEHAHVRLHFFEVAEWEGNPVDHVHSALSWQRADALSVSPMLPANGPILKALRLPRRLGVTHAWEIGVEAQLESLERALAGGLRFVQIRENALPDEVRERFLREALARCAEAGALAVVNGIEALALRHEAQGVHLSAKTLAQATRRPDVEWVGASCHTRQELERAAELGLDYAVVGHVCATASHPGEAPLGWAGFAELIRELPLPVLAIGGMAPDDITVAQRHGGHGIAMIRAAWA